MPHAQSARPRVLVVSYLCADPLTPRGARTQAVVEALARHADVHVIGAPIRAARRSTWQRARDRALSEIGSRWLVDPVEPWAWKALAGRRLVADVALLIGYPFSPLVAAGHALRHAGIPYVVDMSDPWALTRADAAEPTWRDRRGIALERRLWSEASAGIVTTAGQARDLHGAVPGLDLLVRPNGYAHVEPVSPLRNNAPADELRIAHFGALYTPRVAIAGLLRRVAEGGRWQHVVLDLYGSDDANALDALSGIITVRARQRVAWSEAVRLAATEFDLALVVGNSDARQLPSKAVEYLTLPVPRLALTSGARDDSLARYVDDRPGWLTLAVDDPDPATRIAAHVGRSWRAEELAAPPEEGWPHVAESLAAFVLERAA